MVVVIVLGKHVPRGHLRGVELAAAKDARRRVHHGRAGGVEAILHGVHGGGRAIAGAAGGGEGRKDCGPSRARGVVLFCGCGRCGRWTRGYRAGVR